MQKYIKSPWLRNYNTNNIKRRNGRHYENSQVFSSLLIKVVSKTIQNEASEQKSGVIGMLLRTLGASLLGNMLTGRWANIAGDGIIRVGQGSKRPSENKNTTLSFN